MDNNFDKKRKNIRVKKTFFLEHFSKSEPTAVKEISQLKDISLGGLSFTTSNHYEPHSELIFNIRIPHLEEDLYVEGWVKGVNEKVQGKLYEIHVEYTNLPANAKSAIEHIVKDYRDNNIIFERRRHIRMNKNFIVRYFEQNNPAEKYEVTQIKNISKGGMCLVTSHHFPPSSLLTIELKTPQFTDLILLEGQVLECKERIKNIIYEVRLKFAKLNPQADIALDKIIEFLKAEMDKKGKE